MCIGRASFGIIASLLATASALAQAPAGAEFRVSSGTTFVYQSGVAADPKGAFMVVWTDLPQGSLINEIHARRFDPRGAPLGDEFTVNFLTSAFLTDPTVVVDAKGRAVIAWSRRPDGASPSDLFARLYDSAGAPVGPEFMVNSSTTADNFAPSVASVPGGGFVVAWSVLASNYRGLAGRRYDAAGNALGPVFALHSYATSGGAGYRASVAADDSGRFVVVWRGIGEVDSETFGQRFDAAGVRLGAEFRVNDATTGDQYNPRVASDAEGNFIVIWKHSDVVGTRAVLGRRFDKSGTPLGSDFPVHTFSSIYNRHAFVAADRAGNFTVTWDDPDQSDLGVFGRRFSAAGIPRGPAFQLGTNWFNSQEWPSVATDGNGNLFMSWVSRQPFPEMAIYGQRYGGLIPAGMTVVDGGNNVLEVGENVGLLTSWRNVSGAAQTFQGRSSNVVVPPGLMLTFGSDADYGTVADGATGACSASCIAGALTGTRPVGHVDLAFVETIQPDAQGQAKRWALHVGDSFSDVPRASGFYRFIETLLHRGVTSGCAAESYCPGVATTREQMAPFVLVAREGAAYAPPACGTPMFADVPASSPFCRWIEELASRGVVSGCAPGLYCPTAAVTREQMAVFVLRTLDPALDPPACTTPAFADVPASSPFCRWIEELARRGVVTGCGGGNYCPAAPVTREQMAVFLTATFGLTLYGP